MQDAVSGRYPQRVGEVLVVGYVTCYNYQTSPRTLYNGHTEPLQRSSGETMTVCLSWFRPLLGLKSPCLYRAFCKSSNHHLPRFSLTLVGSPCNKKY